MHRSRAYLTASLALALLFGSAAPAIAATRAEADAHKAAAAAARKQAAAANALAKKLQDETVALDRQIDALQADADALDPQIATAQERTAQLERDIADLRAQIASKEAQIAEATEQYATQQQLLSDRVSATYRQGDWFYIDVLLGSQNIGDLITRTELVMRVIRSNNDAARRISTAKHDLETAKVELDRSLEAVAEKRREAQAAQASLESLQSQRQGKVNAQAAVFGQKSALMAESKANAAKLLAQAQAEEAESARITAELARASHGSGRYAGTMAWPVPGFNNITSPFGWRIHPVLKTKKFHAGIDIGKNGDQPIDGAAIVAAGDGEVIFAGYRNGYGDTIMIDHGNGVVTLYGHQRSGGLKVSVGDRVTKGQRIGTVGSTGISTAPHLHFEVRVNGNPVDPMGYL